MITAICRDADANATCDADDPCPVPTTKAKVTASKLGAPAGDEKLRFKGEVALGSPAALDPVRRGARLRLKTALGGVVTATVPPGAGWRANKAGTAWTFTSKLGAGPSASPR